MTGSSGLSVDAAALKPAEPAAWAPAPPIWSLIDDPEIGEVLIDGPYQIDVVRQGRLEASTDASSTRRS